MAAKKPPENPVTDEHVKKFEAYLDKWRVLLNLSDWRIVRKRGRSSAAVMCSMEDFDIPHKMVRYKLGRDFGQTPVTDESLEALVVHELLHLRMHEALELAAEDGEYSDRVMSAEHSSIEVLTNLLMKLPKPEPKGAT